MSDEFEARLRSIANQQKANREKSRQSMSAQEAKEHDQIVNEICRAKWNNELFPAFQTIIDEANKAILESGIIFAIRRENNIHSQNIDELTISYIRPKEKNDLHLKIEIGKFGLVNTKIFRLAENIMSTRITNNHTFELGKMTKDDMKNLLMELSERSRTYP